MKISWGTGIAGTYIIFLIVVISTVLFTATLDINLVTDDYYEKELVYQQEIEKHKRTLALPEQLLIKPEGKNLILKFPGLFEFSDVGGDLHLYRPSDREQDFHIPVQTDSSGIQTIPLNKLSPGVWKVKVNWNVNEVSYFNEKIIMVD